MNGAHASVPRPMPRISFSLKRMACPRALTRIIWSSPSESFYPAQNVARAQFDGDDAAPADIFEIRQWGFLHHAAFRHHYHKVLAVGVRLRISNDCAHFFVRRNLQEVMD